MLVWEAAMVVHLLGRCYSPGRSHGTSAGQGYGGLVVRLLGMDLDGDAWWYIMLDRVVLVQGGSR